MNAHDSLEVFGRFLSAMQALAERQPAFVERFMTQAQLYRELAVSEPVTLRARLAELHASNDASPRLVQDLLECFTDVATGSSKDFAYYPPAQELNDFLEWAIGESSADVVHRHLSTALTFDMQVLRAGLIEATKADHRLGFERRVRTLADVLSRCAEQWYRPILGATLGIVYEASGREKATVPMELGALMSAISNNDRIPDSILYDGVRVVRNAIAHSGISFDLASETVTFVNKKRRGDEETLGPMMWDDLVEVAWGCVFAWSALALVCKRARRVTSSETG